MTRRGALSCDGYDLDMVPGERLGTKVIVNICGVANNQHLHGAPLP